jgi:hypothetical protein
MVKLKNTSVSSSPMFNIPIAVWVPTSVMIPGVNLSLNFGWNVSVMRFSYTGGSQQDVFSHS